jgi:hypothetical protein
MGLRLRLRPGSVLVLQMAKRAKGAAAKQLALEPHLFS